MSKRLTHVRFPDGEALALPDPDLVSKLEDVYTDLADDQDLLAQAREVVQTFWQLVQVNKRDRGEMVHAIRQGLAHNAKLAKEQG